MPVIYLVDVFSGIFVAHFMPAGDLAALLPEAARGIGTV